MKAIDKRRKGIPVVCPIQKQCPCKSAPKVARGGTVIPRPTESRFKLQFKILGNINQCI